MASVKILLKTNKTLANGAHPIAIRIIKDRKAKFMFTGKSATKQQWDAEKGLPNKKHPLQKELIIFLKKKEMDAEREIMEYEGDDIYFSAQTVKNNLRKSKASKNFFDYAMEMINDLNAIGHMGGRNRIKSCRNALLRFTNGVAHLDFKEITPSFLLRYENYLRIQGVKDSTIRFYMVGIASVFKHAQTNTKLIKDNMNPFKVYDLKKLNCEPHHRALEKEKIERIFQYVAEEGSLDFHALNYFKFSYYGWGINMVDVAKLKWKDIHNNRIYYVRTKTKKAFNLPILPPMQQILDYYQSANQPHPQDYIFPILNDAVYNTPDKKVNRIQSKTKDTNKRLRKIAKAVGINDWITTYMTRHSFATNLRDLQVPTAKIQQFLGHKSEVTTQTYLDAIKSSELDEAVMLLVNPSLAAEANGLKEE